MKRIVGFCLLLLFVPLCLRAQAALEVPEMYVGATAGATGSMVMFNPKVEQSFQIGMNAGATFRYIGNRNVGFQLELNYMQVGWQETETETAHECMLNYLELPFLTHIFFGKSVLRGFVNIGPKVGVVLWEDRNELSGTLKPQHEAIDNRFDYGLAGGLGMVVNTRSAGCYQIEARYSFSLGNVYANSKKDYFGASNVMALSVNLGWLMPLKTGRH